MMARARAAIGQMEAVLGVRNQPVSDHGVMPIAAALIAIAESVDALAKSNREIADAIRRSSS